MIIFWGMGVFKYLALVSVFCGMACAVPASKRFYEVTQPDGSVLSVRTMGNETSSYRVTEDGYAVVRDSAGFFSYVAEDGSVSGIRAHERSRRSIVEDDFLNAVHPEAVRRTLEERKGDRQFPTQVMTRKVSQDSAGVSAEVSTPAIRKMPSADKNLNSGERKALVVLVQFADLKFATEDPKGDYEKYLNQEGYSENNNVGSVRDYFKENSSGKFVPDFEVVGPVTLKGSAYKDYGPYSKYGNDGARVALGEALDSLKAAGTVDFTQFDNDSDGYLDFVHMIYAGVGSNDSYQDSALWPHMWYMSVMGEATMGSRKTVASTGSGFRKTYYYVDNYACSNELDGISRSKDKSSTTKVGVGTFIHEFSHLLGLADHYATDGTDTYTLGSWDVMDLGAYNCPYQEYPISCAPPYYSAFERLYLGWMSEIPEVTFGSVQLSSVKGNEALRISNPKNSDEFFVLEYRERTGWDVGIPNHGMLVWHIDYDSTTWFNALVNTSERLRVDIEEADGKGEYGNMTADVFPGTSWTKKYTSYSKFVTWDGTDLGVSLTSIAEANDYSYVTFKVNDGKESSSSSSLGVPESSSSVAPAVSSSSSLTVSSSSVPASSSSQTLSSSSVDVSSSSVDESSSSEGTEYVVVEPAVESSSSAEVESSSSEERDIVRGRFAVAGVTLSRTRGVVTVAGLPPGSKSLRVFSLNGHLLMQREVAESGFSLDVERNFGKSPVILQVTQSGRNILRKIL